MSQPVHHQKQSIKMLFASWHGSLVGRGAEEWAALKHCGPGSVDRALVPSHISSGIWPSAAWGWQSEVLKGLVVRPICYVPGSCWPCLGISIHPALLFLLHTLPGVGALCLHGALSYYSLLILKGGRKPGGVRPHCACCQFALSQPYSVIFHMWLKENHSTYCSTFVLRISNKVLQECRE